MTPFRRILVATDFSPCAEAAAGVAAELARQLDAAVELVTVVDISSVTDAGGEPAWRQHRCDEIRREARRHLRALAERRFPAAKEVHVHVFDGGLEPPDLAGEIVRAAEALGCHLVVLGTHGKTGLAHLVLGSVAEKVVRHARMPVLTVRAPA
ncbi:universal stress protein [bacterium]|nr:universal stress protein [bacterium]